MPGLVTGTNLSGTWKIAAHDGPGTIRAEKYQPFFTSGQALSLRERNASSPGITARSL
jgi:hypothetical protein